MASNMIFLAARVEQEPASQELVDKVLEAFGCNIALEWNGPHWYDSQGCRLANHLTNILTCIDAAVALVPEGWFLKLQISADRERNLAWLTGNISQVTGVAPTPAQALTAACLRARAAMEERDVE